MTAGKCHLKFLQISIVKLLVCLFFSFSIRSSLNSVSSRWYNRACWLGVKQQVAYLLKLCVTVVHMGQITRTLLLAAFLHVFRGSNWRRFWIRRTFKLSSLFSREVVECAQRQPPLSFVHSCQFWWTWSNFTENVAWLECCMITTF